MEKEIKILLTLENGEQATAVLKMVNAEYEHVQKTSEALKANPMLKEFARDLLEVGVVSKDASEGISEFINYNNITEKQIQEVITALKTEQSSVGMLTESYKKYEAAITNISNATNQIARSQNQLGNSSANSTRQVGQQFTGMNQVIGQTGFLLSDMDMFFRSNDWVTNVRMGAMSVSNNFSMVGMTIANALRQAETQGISWQQMLKGSLSGINLWLIGLNAGVFAIQLFTTLFKSNTEEVKNNTEELKKNADQYNRMTNEQLKFKKMDLERQIKELETQHPSRKRTLPSFDMRRLAGGQSPFYKEEVSDEDRFGDDYKKYDLLKSNLSLVERSTLYLGKQEEAEIRITANKEKLRQLNEKNYALIVSGAKSEEDARKKLSQWIATDQATVSDIIGKTKSLADQLKIQTNAELDIEIQKLKVLLSQTTAIEDQLRIRDAIRSKEKEKIAPLFISSDEVLNKGFSDKAPTDPTKLREGIYGKLKEIPKGEMPDKPLGDTKIKVDEVKSAFQSLGNTMASAISRGITGLKNFKDLLADILGSIIQISIQFAITKGLDYLFPGSDSVLKKASGILPTDQSNGRISSFDNNSYSSGNNIQYLVLSGNVNVKAAGRDLQGSIDKRNVVLNKFYN